MSRDFPLDNVKNRLIVKLTKSGKAFIIFLVNGYQFEPLSTTGKKAGIDVGIEKLLTTSDGYYVPNPRPLGRALEKVKALRKSLSRKKRGSKNREKARIKLANAYEHLDNARKDRYMKIGKKLAEAYDAVLMEYIDMEELIGKSSRRMRMRLLDVGFYQLRTNIQY